MKGLGDTLVGLVDRVVLDRYRDRRLREAVMVARKRRDKDGLVVQSVNDQGKLEDVWELPSITVRVRGHVANRYTPSPVETAAVMRELEGWARVALLLYAATGARLDEVAGLKVSQARRHPGPPGPCRRRGSPRAAGSAAGAPSSRR